MRALTLFLFTLCSIFSLQGNGQESYKLEYHFADKDTLPSPESLGLKLGFSSRNDCILYINSLPNQLKTKGFITFSVDSVHFDSSFAEVWVFVGQKYIWKNITIKSADAESVSGTRLSGQAIYRENPLISINFSYSRKVL
jgi:hypothetical protein